MIKQPVRSIFVLAATLCLSGCAAQSTFKAYYDSEELLNRALEVEPNSPDLQKASLEIEAGRNLMNEARYGQATSKFSYVSRTARKVLEENGRRPGMAPPQDQSIPREAQRPGDRARVLGESSVPKTPSPQSAPQRQAKAEAPEPEQPKTESPGPRMGLPEKALAAYLARKKDSKPSSDAGEKKPAPKPKLKAPVPEPRASATVQEEPKAEQPRDEGGPVKATAKPKAKAVPEDAKESTKVAKSEEEEAPPEVSGDEVVEPEKPKPQGPPRRKLPGDIVFKTNQSSLNARARDSLDQMSQYLVENPSNTLLMVGVVGPSENLSMIDQRFESLKAYLVNQGVPEDQIRLDVERKSGQQAEFEMFLIEH